MVLDATAALGRVDLAGVSGWSVLTGWAGAFGGPASVGLLVIRNRARWRAPYPVDDYQGGRWPGVPDVPAIHAAAVALDWWLRSGRGVGERQRRLVDRLRTGIAETVPDVDIAGDPVHRLPQLLTFSVLYVDGETLTLELDRAGFAVASGSACSASSEHPSHVLAAMGALTHGQRPDRSDPDHDRRRGRGVPGRAASDRGPAAGRGRSGVTRGRSPVGLPGP